MFFYLRFDIIAHVTYNLTTQQMQNHCTADRDHFPIPIVIYLTQLSASAIHHTKILYFVSLTKI